MRRETPNSRPRGLGAQRPPAAATATCAAQQLPKLGSPAYAARAKSICRRTRGSSCATIVSEDPVQTAPS